MSADVEGVQDALAAVVTASDDLGEIKDDEQKLEEGLSHDVAPPNASIDVEGVQDSLAAVVTASEDLGEIKDDEQKLEEGLSHEVPPPNASIENAAEAQQLAPPALATPDKVVAEEDISLQISPDEQAAASDARLPSNTAVLDQDFEEHDQACEMAETVEAPPLAPPAAPPTAPQAAPPAGATRTIQTMRVTVPAGAAPGQTIQFQTPSGQLVQVAVPLGVTPGQAFSVAIPGVAMAPRIDADNYVPFVSRDVQDCCYCPQSYLEHWRAICFITSATLMTSLVLLVLSYAVWPQDTQACPQMEQVFQGNGLSFTKEQGHIETSRDDEFWAAFFQVIGSIYMSIAASVLALTVYVSGRNRWERKNCWYCLFLIVFFPATPFLAIGALIAYAKMSSTSGDCDTFKAMCSGDTSTCYDMTWHDPQGVCSTVDLCCECIGGDAYPETPKFRALCNNFVDWHCSVSVHWQIIFAFTIVLLLASLCGGCYSIWTSRQKSAGPGSLGVPPATVGKTRPIALE